MFSEKEESSLACRHLLDPRPGGSAVATSPCSAPPFRHLRLGAPCASAPAGCPPTVPASPRYTISSAAGTGGFGCQLGAQLLKTKTWPISSIICFRQDLDLPSGTVHTITVDTSPRTKNCAPRVSGHIFTCSFQMQSSP